MSKEVVFRVDAYSEIGYGHLVRSLSLSEEFIRRGFLVTFVSFLDDFCVDLLSEKKIRLIRAPYRAGSDKDRNFMCSFLKELSQKPIFIHDNYDIDYEYEITLRDFIRLIVAIDDIAIRKFASDIIINQNYGAENYLYNAREETIYCCGHKYIMLRDEVLSNKKDELNQKVENILLLFGGTDAKGLSLEYSRLLLENSKINAKINIVINREHKDIEKLRELAHIDKRIKLWHNIKNVGSFFKNMDLAIIAPGSVVWELLYIGVPIIAIITADNQEGIAYHLSRENMICYMGEFGDFDPDIVSETVGSLYVDFNRRKVLFKKGHGFIDGEGKKRIIARISVI